MILRSRHSDGFLARAYYGSVFDRLCQRYGWSVSRNDRLLRAMTNCEKGETASPVRNGSSLTAADLVRVRSFATFGSSRIHLILPQTSWPPTLYFLHDGVLLRNSLDEMPTVRGVSFFPAGATVTHGGQARYDRHHPRVKARVPGGFGTDPRTGFFWGGTVVDIMFKIASFLGFGRIILLGVDNSYSRSSGSMGGKDPVENEEPKTGGDHYLADDYREWERWIHPDVEFPPSAIARARKFFVSWGVEVLNASHRTALPGIPRIDFDSVVEPAQTGSLYECKESPPE
jgi:hypothetical protein